MKWEKKTLGELIEIKKGTYITKSESKEGPYPVILGSPKPAYYIDRYNHTGKAIVVSRSGSAGTISRWNEPIFVTDGYLIEPNELVEFEFLYYLMKYHQKQLQESKNGVAIPHVNPRIINSIEVCFPPLPTQQKIADILSAYDDLIETNRRQIKLLEEAAQRLYKEWFVDLRFPGWENAKIGDGVPEGWRIGELGDIAIETGKNEKKSRRDQYEYYLPIDRLPKKSLVYIEKADLSLAESSLIGFQSNDILFGSLRPYFHKVVIARDKGLTRSTCFVINSIKPEYWSFLVMLLFSSSTIEYATKISVGTTMPYVRWNDFKRMLTVIPSEEICLHFHESILPIIKHLFCIADSYERLQESRDRLLPKLMTGAIEV